MTINQMDDYYENNDQYYVIITPAWNGPNQFH